MLTVLLLGLAPLVVAVFVVACMRRALAIMVAGLATWSSFNATGQVWDALWAGASVLMIGMITLDVLSRTAATRRVTIVLEWLASLVLALLFTFAVCYSGGLRDSALVLALTVSALLATYATLSFRLMDEHWMDRSYRDQTHSPQAREQQTSF